MTNQMRTIVDVCVGSVVYIVRHLLNISNTVFDFVYSVRCLKSVQYFCLFSCKMSHECD